jgi:hypothetical protein
MKTKNYKKNQRKSAALPVLRVCPNCKELTTHGHYAPPSLGEAGFWICETKEKLK